MLPNRKVGTVITELIPVLKHLLQDLYPVIQGQIYTTNKTRPRFTNIIAQDNGHRRFALIDSVLDSDRLPHVYEVGMFDGKSMNQFYIFFSQGHNICVNQAVKALSSDLLWTGDILIVRGSAQSQGVVNMRGRDSKLADFALKK